jgi:hypothetical protein
VQTAFGDKLKPDKPDPAVLAYGYKYLNSVGVSDNTALVIVGYRIRQRPTAIERDFDHFLAFNYDFVSGAVSEVVDPERTDVVALYMYNWRFIRLARFEPLSVPDVVFTYLSCTECEEEKILASLRYDSATRIWQIRSWGNGEPEWWRTRVGLVINRDISASSSLSYDCLYGFLGDGAGDLERVAIRCREVTEDEQRKSSLADSTIIYSLKEGSFSGNTVTTKDQRLKIWSDLCRTSPQAKLCKNVQKPAGSQP